MQLDSPSGNSNRATGAGTGTATTTATAAASQFTPGSRPIPPTPRLKPPPPVGGGVSSSFTTPSGRQRIRHRGFPPEPPSAATDDRGFPLLEKNDFHGESHSYINCVEERLFTPTTATPSLNNQRAMRGNGNDNNGGGGDKGKSNSSGVAAAAVAASDRGRRHHPQNQRRLLSQSLTLPPPPPSSSSSPGLAPRQTRNLFLSPFSSTLPPEKATLAETTTRFDGNRTSWVGQVAGPPGGGGGGSDIRGGQGQQGAEHSEGGVRGRWGGGGWGGDGRDNPVVGQESSPPPPPPLSPTRRGKGSHAKLDLLLREMQRLNGRLDTIVGRLGALEEWRAETGTAERR